MTTIDARILVNPQAAAPLTGPKNDADKARSRAIAFKHGLTVERISRRV